MGSLLGMLFAGFLAVIVGVFVFKIKKRLGEMMQKRLSIIPIYRNIYPETYSLMAGAFSVLYVLAGLFIILALVKIFQRLFNGI